MGIISLSSRQPARSLENLNRLTGLDFQSWPESLIDGPVCCGAVLGDTALPTLNTEDTHEKHHGRTSLRQQRL